MPDFENALSAEELLVEINRYRLAMGLPLLKAGDITDIEALWKEYTKVRQQWSGQWGKSQDVASDIGTPEKKFGQFLPFGAWSPPTPTGTELQVPSTIGGAKDEALTPGLVRKADGTFEDREGKPLSKALADKMYSDYWNPPQKGTQRDFIQYTTRTSDELERLGVENEQMRKAQMWERERAEAARSIGTGPRDWIRQWEMNQQRNPWIPTPRTEGEKLESAYAQQNEWLKANEPKLKAYKALLSSGALQSREMVSDMVFDPVTGQNVPLDYQISGGGYKVEAGKRIPNWRVEVATKESRKPFENFITAYQDKQKQATAIHDVLVAEFGTQASEPRAWGEPGNMTIGAGDVGGGAPRPTTPPTPSWLKGMYPQLGANITPQPIRPLSGQQWLSMPESQRQGWQGFAEWSGAIPMDVMSQMEMMLPNTPVGAGRTSWRPARQRGSF